MQENSSLKDITIPVRRYVGTWTISHFAEFISSEVEHADVSI